MRFWVFLFITEELGRTFLSLLPHFAITETMKFGEIKFVFVLAWFSDFSRTINAFLDTVWDLISSIPCWSKPSTVSFLIVEKYTKLRFSDFSLEVIHIGQIQAFPHPSLISITSTSGNGQPSSLSAANFALTLSAGHCLGISAKTFCCTVLQIDIGWWASEVDSFIPCVPQSIVVSKEHWQWPCFFTTTLGRQGCQDQSSDICAEERHGRYHCW